MGISLTAVGIFLPSIEVDLAASANDWAPTGLSGAVVIYVRNTSGGTPSITGITGGEDGRLLAIVHAGGGTGAMTLEHENASSSAANRVDCRNNVARTFSLGASTCLIYASDGGGGGSRWRQCGNS